MTDHETKADGKFIFVLYSALLIEVGVLMARGAWLICITIALSALCTLVCFPVFEKARWKATAMMGIGAALSSFAAMLPYLTKESALGLWLGLWITIFGFVGMFFIVATVQNYHDYRKSVLEEAAQATRQS